MIFLFQLYDCFITYTKNNYKKNSAQNKVEHLLYSICTVINNMSISTASFMNCISYVYCLNVSSVHSAFYSAQLQIYPGMFSEITSLSVQKLIFLIFIK